MIIDPGSVPRVAVESMNDVHLEEVDMLNAFGDTLKAFDGSANSVSRIDDDLAALVRHQREHFASEEVLMESTGFPALVMHQQEHDRQLAMVESIVAQWRKTRNLDVLRDFFQDDMPAWVANHILTMDTVTAHYVAARS